MAYLHIIDNSGTLDADILGGTLRLRKDSWQTSYESDGRVTETAELVAEAADATIIVAAIVLEKLKAKVDLHANDSINNEAVWWVSYATGETAKRSLIQKMTITPLAKGKYTSVMGYSAMFYQLSVTRSSDWEDSASSTLLALNNLAGTGGYVALAAKKGSLNPRISLTTLTIDSANTFGSCWIGLRPAYAGTSSFRPSWSLYDDAVYGTDTGDADDGINHVGACGFATSAALLKRASITLAAVAPDTNYSHFRGRYLVLMRARVTSGGSVGVQLQVGVANGAFAPRKEVFFTYASYDLYEMGEVDIPADGAASIKNTQLQIWAERMTDTSCTLYIDRLILIPTYSYIAVKSPWSNILDATHGLAYVSLSESGLVRGWSVLDSDSESDANLEVSAPSWSYPVGGGVLVFATDTAVPGNVTLTGYNRHLNHREA